MEIGAEHSAGRMENEGHEFVLYRVEALSACGEERSDGRVRTRSLLVRALLRLGLALASLETHLSGQELRLLDPVFDEKHALKAD